MKKVPGAALLAALLAGCASIAPPSATTGVEYANGRWFDGIAFRDGSFYVAEGRLTFRRPGTVTEVRDLKGGYAVPAFTEAHNHNVDNAFTWPTVNAQYLKDGIYYLKNPNNLERMVRDVRPLTGRADTIDVIFSNGGLTSPTGHPIALYRQLLQYPAFAGVKAEDLADSAYYVVDTDAALEAKWGAILAGKPDFLKVYLLRSEGHEENIANPRLAGYNGLPPAMVPKIVARAKAANLRVTAHVETAADFATAVRAGVDEINHLPGYWIRQGEPVERYAISEELAREAAARNVTVVTTTGLTVFLVRDAELLKKTQDNQVANLRRLHAAGVKIAIGSDNYMGNASGEALHLQKIGAFDNATLLRLWTETSAQAVFPGRRIGRIAEDYEADFLVLSGDPVAEFGNVRRISMRVKKGAVLPPM